MLFDARVWPGLADGTITLAFRRWRTSQAKPGTRLRTPAGVLEVDAVEVIAESHITDADARRAGFGAAGELLAELSRYEGTIHRVAFHFVGPDPRVALRERSEMSEDEVAEVRRRLERLDRASRTGPWTETVLRLIAERPAARAADLARSLGRDTLPLKRDIRKLKELGLTESLDVGYRLSPRGQALVGRSGAWKDGGSTLPPPLS